MSNVWNGQGRFGRKSPACGIAKRSKSRDHRIGDAHARPFSLAIRDSVQGVGLGAVAVKLFLLVTRSRETVDLFLEPVDFGFISGDSVDSRSCSVDLRI